jgi:hypothetical protein
MRASKNGATQKRCCTKTYQKQEANVISSPKTAEESGIKEVWLVSAVQEKVNPSKAQVDTMVLLCSFPFGPLL